VRVLWVCQLIIIVDLNARVYARRSTTSAGVVLTARTIRDECTPTDDAPRQFERCTFHKPRAATGGTSSLHTLGSTRQTLLSLLPCNHCCALIIVHFVDCLMVFLSTILHLLNVTNFIDILVHLANHRPFLQCRCFAAYVGSFPPLGSFFIRSRLQLH